MKKISVIVTVLNEADSIKGLLVALANQSLPADEIVIVDGGSDDGTVDQIEALSHQLKLPVTVYLKRGNRSVGRNFAIHAANHEIIAITDAGCEPHFDWLAELVARYEALKTEAGQQLVVIAGYYDARPSNALETAAVTYFLVMPDRVDPEHFLPATRSMLLEKAAWQLVGGFDERLDHNEDYPFARKLTTLPNVQMGFTAKAKVTWIPPTLTLLSFGRILFRFALGDIQAGILRPKVVGIFLRYVGTTIAVIAIATISVPATLVAAILGLLIYSSWSIKKNIRYAPQAWYWLPVLQIVSDVAVMAGSLSGVNYAFHKDR